MVGVKPASGLKISADGEAPSSLSSLLNAAQYSVLSTRQKNDIRHTILCLVRADGRMRLNDSVSEIVQGVEAGHPVRLQPQPLMPQCVEE